jgi:signal transduction histidine kinase
MSEVIWSLDTKNDTLDNLINYMIQFVNKMFETSRINLILKPPTQIPHLSLRPDYRWNIYLIFKETINNIIKHSEAKNTHCTIDFNDTVLSFIIYDDGKGFIDTTKTNKGYGLQNIRRRAKALNAVLNFLSEPGKGTKIEFYINLNENPPI